MELCESGLFGLSRKQEVRKDPKVQILSIPPERAYRSNGKTAASKSANVGSIPTALAKFQLIQSFQ